MTLIAAYLVALLAHAAVPAGIPECRDADFTGRPQTTETVAAQRQAPLPTVVYGGGAESVGPLGFQATFAVDAKGRISCYRLAGNWYSRKFSLNAPRRAWLKQLAGVRYRPFPQGAAIVTESVREVRAIAKVRRTPQVPLDQVTITFSRSGCFGACPNYTVEIRGDGQVIYTGGSNVDVRGEHRYRIPATEVGKLVESLRSKQLWSMEKEYVTPISDNPRVTLTLQLGPNTHSIVDYVGRSAGMPAEVDAFQAEVDAAAGVERWINLGVDTVARLEQEGFDPKSRAAVDLLWSAAGNPRSEDKAITRLLALGVPASVTPPANIPRDDRTARVAEMLLRRRHLEAARGLLEAGALRTDGRGDPVKAEAALRGAVEGGRLAGVEAVWAAASEAKPPLSTEDVDEQHRRRQSMPVALLLNRDNRDDAWEGLQIAQWLVAHGGDLRGTRANGDTLLHIAARANDVALVRYLLELGLDPMEKGASGLAPISATHDEDVALALLEGGMVASSLGGPGSHFYNFAKGNYWSRVVTLLDKR